MATATGSALRWGPLWGARAQDWAALEEQQVPTYEEAIRRAGITQGTSVLEVGCGSGVFLRAAAGRGAEVAGLDASAELIELARRRLPDAELVVGDMQALPFGDDSFDVVAGFNAFFFAADMVAALREAGRVARETVVVQVWGAPERCELEALKQAIGPYMPPAEPGPPLWQDGVLEGIVAEAGLEPVETFDVSWAYEFPDEDALARALLSPGLVTIAIERGGLDAVRSAIVAAMEPYRTAHGYSLENEWHTVIARA
jgi:SAM-dependent methyltransferase